VIAEQQPVLPMMALRSAALKAWFAQSNGVGLEHDLRCQLTLELRTSPKLVICSSAR
jgi:hypothetical protein